MKDDLIQKIEDADVIRFLDWYEDDPADRIKMTIGLWNDSEHELADLGREFKKKVLEYYKNKKP